MSLVCSLSNETPETPVISPVSGHIFEKRLILKYIDENGSDPINNEPLTSEALIAIKASPFVLPKPPSATSIPAILKALQDEWDAVMLQSFTLRQHLQTARQELSHSLYQHDAACRVIARLSKEVTAAREALATLKPQAGATNTAISASQQQIETPTNERSADSNLQEEIGMSEELKSQLQESSIRLTADRKKRGKTIPQGLATQEDISTYTQITSQTGLHSSSMPGVLCLDVCKARPERIITGGNDKNATVFNTSTSQVVSMLQGHSKKVTHVSYHPEEQIVFTGSADSTVRIWGADQGQCASMLRAHSAAISGLSVHTSGDFILTSSYDGTWAFNDIRRGQVLVRVSGTEKSGTIQNLTCAQCHPDGIILGTGTTDGEIKIWDLKQKNNVANFSHCVGGSRQDVISISFSENGYFLASSGADGQIKLWDLRRLKNFKTIIPDEGNNDAGSYEIRNIEFDQTGTYLGVCGSDAKIYFCKTWDQIRTFDEHTAAVTAIKFGKLAGSILTSSLDRSVKIYSKAEAME